MSSAETAEFMAEHLKLRYGDTVEVKFVDLANGMPKDPEDRAVAENIRSQGLMLPLVAINGTPRIRGIIAYRLITDAIDTLREVGDG